MTSRLEKIQAMLADEPNDVFLRYSLAMELRSVGQLDQPLEILRSLIQEESPYVPAYFRSAQILAEEQRIEESRSYLREGIEVARAQGDLHAAGEMSEMLADLGQYGE